ncbi:MAG: hypothetical protein HFI85_05805 [Clostridia bacterium]|nr:hypothetical protein [Clostridia bacterium]
MKRFSKRKFLLKIVKYAKSNGLNIDKEGAFAVSDNYFKFLNGLNDFDKSNYEFQVAFKIDPIAEMAKDAVELDIANKANAPVVITELGSLLCFKGKQINPEKDDTEKNGFEEDEQELPELDDVYYRD